MNKTIFAVPKKECLGCSHLVAFGKNEEPCSKEVWCPASAVQVVLGTNMNEKATALADAWLAEDRERIAHLMIDMDDMHQTIQDKIWTMAKGRLAMKK